MCFCVLLYFTACMLYYCNTVGWVWWDWGFIWWLTILLQCFDTVGWVTWPVKILSPNDLYCVEWDVKPYSTQLPEMTYNVMSGTLNLYTSTSTLLSLLLNHQLVPRWKLNCSFLYASPYLSQLPVWLRQEGILSEQLCADCVTQCSQSAHLYEQFLQVKQIGFVTLEPLRCAWRRLPRVVLL